MKVYDFDPRNLPPELLQAIGLFVSSSAHTESLIEQGVAGCLGLGLDYGMIVTSHLSMPQRFQMIRAASKRRVPNPEFLAAMDNQLVRLEDAFNRRNRIVHRGWCRYPPTGELFIVKQEARKELKMELIPMTVVQVNEDARFMYQTGIDFFSFLGVTGLLPDLPSPSPPTNPQT